MPQQISRLYNFVNDKNNGIPITSSRVDAELNQLVLTANGSAIVQPTAPVSPFNGELWIDSTNNILKQYRNNEWVMMGVVQVASSAMVTPQKGDFWYNTSTNVLGYWNGSAWVTAATLGVNTFVGTQKWAKGANVASATAMTLGEDGNAFLITGTTTITSITIKAAGTAIYLEFSGILTLTNGSNLSLAANLITAAGTVICLVSDGTNWVEVCRSPATVQTTSMLGAWSTKSTGTPIQALTDGLVIVTPAYASINGGTDNVYGYSDSANPPTTERGRCDTGSTTTDLMSSICFPVRKNDYFKVVKAGSRNSPTVYFIPLGS